MFNPSIFQCLCTRYARSALCKIIPHVFPIDIDFGTGKIMSSGIDQCRNFSMNVTVDTIVTRFLIVTSLYWMGFELITSSTRNEIPFNNNCTNSSFVVTRELRLFSRLLKVSLFSFCWGIIHLRIITQKWRKRRDSNPRTPFQGSAL